MDIKAKIKIMEFLKSMAESIDADKAEGIAIFYLNTEGRLNVRIDVRDLETCDAILGALIDNVIDVRCQLATELMNKRALHDVN